MEQRRNYGIDLLRNVLMLFIIIGHLFAHTGIRNELSFLSNKWIFTWALQTLTVSAVNCFVIITGYYMASGVYCLWKGVKLWFKVLFYSVSIWLVLLLAGNIKPTWGGTRCILPHSSKRILVFYNVYFTPSPDTIS